MRTPEPRGPRSGSARTAFGGRRTAVGLPCPGPPPEEKYIGSAAGVPGMDAGAYGHMWVVETGHSKVEAPRPHTRSKLVYEAAPRAFHVKVEAPRPHTRSKGARLLYALAIFNSQAVRGARLRVSSTVRRRLRAMTQLELRVAVLDMLFAEVLKPPRMRPRCTPPRPVRHRPSALPGSLSPASPRGAELPPRGAHPPHGGQTVPPHIRAGA